MVTPRTLLRRTFVAMIGLVVAGAPLSARFEYTLGAASGDAEPSSEG